MFRNFSRSVDQRFGTAKFANSQLKKVFPDHWSFMLGEVTLYCFIVVLVTGVYLTFFFEPSTREVIYNGSYEPLKGVPMTAAYESAVNLSLEVKGGLVMRQMHHWSALLFVAAMVVHMARVFFTGAYRKPREVNWVFGVVLLILSMFNGLLGYSLLEDLLSGTGLRVAHSILLSIPFIGPDMAWLVFGGPFDSPTLIPRFYVLHVLLLPAAIIALLAVHLFLVWYQKHTQYRGPRRTNNNVVGLRILPTFAAKAIGLMFLVTGVIAIISGLAQINPIWEFGPFNSTFMAGAVTSAAQPDWYMSWLDGMLRLIPGWETRIGGYVIPNYFWGGLVFAGVVFIGMGAWPWIENRYVKDNRIHNIADKPRDNPTRTAIGAAFFTLMAVIFTATANDVLATFFHVPPENITWFLRVALFVAPVIVFFATRWICRGLQGTDAHPASPGPSHTVMRTPDGGFEFAHGDHSHDDDQAPHEDPEGTKA